MSGGRNKSGQTPGAPQFQPTHLLLPGGAATSESCKMEMTIHPFPKRVCVHIVCLSMHVCKIAYRKLPIS
jgi:predicted metal-binding protein